MEATQLHNGKNLVVPVLPLISIVMATYNGSRYLSQQMESIVVQSYPNIEITIVDDCSTDNTIGILKSFQLKHSNIKIFSNENNLGYVKNFEKACSLATGEYIALCDQDDYWQPQKLEKMYAEMGNKPLIFCDSVICDENLKPMGVKLSDRINCMDFNNCLQQAIFGRIPGHAMLFTKSLLDKCLPFAGAANHDWWLGFAATIYGGIKFLPEPLVYYRQHSTNLFGAVGNKNKKNKQQLEKERRQGDNEQARSRIKAFYDFCPRALIKEREVLRKLVKTYQSFSLINNFQRMLLFFKNHELLLASKKRTVIRNYLFCIKMFVMIK